MTVNINVIIIWDVTCLATDTSGWEEPSTCVFISAPDLP